MSHTYDRSFSLKINEETWTFFLITEEEATELDQKLNDLEEGFKALTVLDDRSVFIVEGSVNQKIIAHELFHIFVWYLRLHSADITVDNFEEIIAELLENDLDRFLKIRKKIYNKYKKLEGSK
jgi:regulator of sigma D